MASTKKKAKLYVRIEATTKAWLKKLCAKQVGRVSQSTMIERILQEAMKK